MNEIVAVFIAIFVLIGGIVAYGVISTSMGYEQDENQNYIPDRLERMFVKTQVQKKEKNKIKTKKGFKVNLNNLWNFGWFLSPIQFIIVNCT